MIEAPKPAEHFDAKDYISDSTTYRALTRLPFLKDLKEIEDLPPFIQEELRKCLENIYAPVTQREQPEDSPHFAHTHPITLYYEHHNDVLIYGKKHTIKAAAVLPLIDKVLKEINAKLNHPETIDNQKVILHKFRAILTVHRNGITEAMATAASEEDKRHLEKHQHHNVDNTKPLPLSPNSKLILASCFPVTPEKEQGAPKKRLTDNDKAAITFLQPKRRLFAEKDIDSSSDEELVVRRRPAKKASEAQKENFLAQQVDALAISNRMSAISKTKEHKEKQKKRP